MARKRVSFLLILGALALAACAAGSGASLRHAPPAADPLAMARNDFNCVANVDGKPTRLRTGEGVRASDGRWEYCDRYDGHSLMVYAAPPGAAEAPSGGHAAMPGARSGPPS